MFQEDHQQGYDFLFGLKTSEQKQCPCEQHCRRPGCSGASPELAAAAAWMEGLGLAKPAPLTVTGTSTAPEGLLFVSKEFQKNSYEKPVNRSRKQALLRTRESWIINTNSASAQKQSPITKNPSPH